MRPHVDKIHEVPNDVWDVLFQGFLSQELLRGLDIPALDERAIEEFEKWSDDENEVVLVLLLLVEKQLWFL